MGTVLMLPFYWNHENRPRDSLVLPVLQWNQKNRPHDSQFDKEVVVMRRLDGVDCATRLNAALAVSLKSKGIQYVGRYLGNSWKSMDKTEADAIMAAGLQIVSIWETNPTHAAYFTKDQGVLDAKEASSYAKAISQTEGSAI